MNARSRWKPGTPRTLAGASLLATLLAGCAGLAPPGGGAAGCSALFAQLQQATREHRDAQYQRLADWPGLRSDRLRASLGADARTAEQRRLWAQRLATHDAEASQVEIAQLAPAQRHIWRSDERQQALDSCRSAQVRRLSEDPHAFSDAAAAARVPDDYHDWARMLGLNPLFKPVFGWGVAAWQRAAARARMPEDGPQWLSYAPLRQASPTQPVRLQPDALGLPQADGAGLDALFARHAPRLRIEQASRSDRIGSPYFAVDGARRFNAQQPRLYRHSGWSRINGRWHLQLVYQLWFDRRPKPHALDLYGGELDGLLWRVTLDARGNALLYDSIHPCGCWHGFYLPRHSPLRFRQPPNEESRLARRLGLDGTQAPTLWLSAGTHHLVWVDERRSPYPALHYRQDALDQLRRLPHPGGRRSLYASDGMVPGSQRLERWLLWPSGVPSPGAMRQWGRHATAFIGRAHFDDPHLLQRYFH
ncbi:hypothetical protein I0D00_04315 [Pseudomonas lalucatii]|uniref:Uncharacterized protein n=1 Tax=Pseudomonas lalucatii TaxID=1424203 RepID=A0ABS5PZ72_9PSED|nr:hypothetical protein [Pseudomonas lalucatii]MBS7661169.1 hypothetical protein [Pseudomonas lalucatii]